VVANRVVEEVRTAVAAEAGQATADELLLGYQTIAQQARKAAGSADDIAETADDVTTSLTGLTDKIAESVKQQDGVAKSATSVADTVTTSQQDLRDLTARTTAMRGDLTTLTNRAGALPGQADDVAGSARSVYNSLTGAADGLPADADSVLATYDSIAPQILALDLTPEQTAAIQAILGSARSKIVTPLTDIKSRAGTVAAARSTAGTLAGQADDLADTAGGINGAAGSVSTGLDDVAAQAGALGNDLTALATGMGQLGTDQQAAATSVGDLTKRVEQVSASSGLVVKAAQRLGDDLRADQDTDIAAPGSGSDAVAGPLAVRTADTAGGGAYGVGLSPFLLGIAAWIGAFVLFLIVRPLSTRALAARVPAWRIALGGWLPAAILGVIQVALMLGVVVFGLGVRPAQPVALAGFLALTSLAFTAVLHALNAAFGRAGVLIGLLLLVLQVATAGGSFPWQTLPPALMPLHFLLPMGYVVDGIRALLYGDSLAAAADEFAVLGGYLLLGLVISTFAARTHRRWTPARLVPTLVV
jgi:putative membrane protein